MEDPIIESHVLYIYDVGTRDHSGMNRIFN